MLVHLREFTVGLKTLYGNSAWVLLHRAPYQALTFRASELTAAEREAGLAPPAAYARRYVEMATALVAAYPCGECRRRAAGDARIQDALARLRADVGALGAGGADGEAVVAMLALGAMRLHCAVSAAATGDDNRDAEGAAADEAALCNAKMEAVLHAMDAGRIPAADVVSLLRARWAGV